MVTARSRTDSAPAAARNCFEKYTVLDRLTASKGYTTENARLICEKCDREVQSERGYA